MLVDESIGLAQVCALLVRRPDLPGAFERLLRVLGHGERCGTCLALQGSREPARPEENRECNGDRPESRYCKLPIEDQQADRDDSRRDVGSVKVRQHVRIYVLHRSGVSHDRLGEIR